jgi:hypothetical protein
MVNDEYPEKIVENLFSTMYYIEKKKIMFHIFSSDSTYVQPSPWAGGGVIAPGRCWLPSPRAGGSVGLCCLACRRPGPVPAAVTALIAAAAGGGGGAQ